jgi:hypothetical protein
MKEENIPPCCEEEINLDNISKTNKEMNLDKIRVVLIEMNEENMTPCCEKEMNLDNISS